MTLPPYFQQTFFGNTLEDYLYLVCILILGILLKRWVSNRLSEGLYRFFKYRKYEVGVELNWVEPKIPVSVASYRRDLEETRSSRNKVEGTE